MESGRTTYEAIMQNIDRLNQLPALIATLAEEMNGHREELYAAESRLKEKLVDYEFTAGMEVNGDGKKKFPNQASREAQALVYAKADEEYRALEKRVAELRNTKFRADTDLEKFRNELGARRAILAAFTETLHGENIRIYAEAKKQPNKIEVSHVTD